MSDHILKTIDEAMAKLRVQEDEVKATKLFINQCRAFIGQPAMFLDVNTGTRATVALKGDEYVGQTQHIACRSILERRKALDLSPCSLEEIYQDLVDGGYGFTTADVENRKRGVAQTLSKGSAIFHKLDNGKYGLKEWYGLKQKATKAESAKVGADDVVVEDDNASDPVQNQLIPLKLTPATNDDSRELRAGPRR